MRLRLKIGTSILIGFLEAVLANLYVLFIASKDQFILWFEFPQGTIFPLSSPKIDLCERLSRSNQPIEQTMERLPNGARRLAAQLITSVEPQFLWSVLTDYDRLDTFIPNLESSTLVSRKDNTVVLKQIGSQQLIGLRFSAQVQLELTENKELGQLNFKLIKGDFRRFEGSWKIRNGYPGKGNCLFYELIVQGCVGMPVSLIEKRLENDLIANLVAVEKEAFMRSCKINPQTVS